MRRRPFIAAPPAVMDIAEDLARQFDSDPADAAAPSRSVRVLAVRNADAAELAANLQQMFDEPDHTERPPAIRVDVASNTLLIRASDEQYRTIEEVVKRVDEHTLAASRQMQVIRIDPSRAPADEIARTLEQMLQQASAPGTRIRVITVDELWNYVKDRTERTALRLCRAQGKRQADQALLGTIVQVPLHAASLLVGRLHDTTTRCTHLLQLAANLRVQLLVLQAESGDCCDRLNQVCG
jgi:hypothetical protein